MPSGLQVAGARRGRGPSPLHLSQGAAPLSPGKNRLTSNRFRIKTDTCDVEKSRAAIFTQKIPRSSRDVPRPNRRDLEPPSRSQSAIGLRAKKTKTCAAHLFELIFQTGREQNTVLGILRWVREWKLSAGVTPAAPRAAVRMTYVTSALQAGAAANPSPPSPRNIASKRLPR